MNYFFKKSSLVPLAVIILLIFFHFAGILGPIEGVLVNLMGLAQQTLFRFAISLNNTYQSYSACQNLMSKNQECEQIASKFAIENARLRTLETENKTLRQTLGFLEKRGINKKYIAVNILGRASGYGSHTIIIDRGKKDGLENGLPLVVNDAILAGKVVRLQENTAIVLLLNDEQSKVAVQLQNNENTPGLLNGSMGWGLVLDMIPQYAAVQKGDLVITSGLEENIPRGLLVGSVEEILTPTSGPTSAIFKSALIKPFISFDTIDFGIILLPA